MKGKIRVLIADDSPFVCQLLQSYLDAVDAIEVVGLAYDGQDALDKIGALEPDVLTLDLEMPKLSGLEVLSLCMANHPTPTVVVSGASGRAATQTLQALERGAVDFVLKFTSGSVVDPETLRQEIISKVLSAAAIKVVRTLPSNINGELTGLKAPHRSPAVLTSSARASQIVVIGSSTGGPQALRLLLAELGPNFPGGVVVVQHIPNTFTSVLAAQLDRQLDLKVVEAGDRDPIAGGTVLIAPGGFHLLVNPAGCVDLRKGPPVGGHCPAIDVTMESASQIFGRRTAGVLLTGMGDDGVAGLFQIRGNGGLTFAQDEASSVIFGMPKQAITKGVVDHIGTPSQIGRHLASLHAPASIRLGVSQEEHKSASSRSTAE